MPKLFVYARTGVQADTWAWQNRVHKHQINFIYRLEKLQGLPRGTQIQLAGDYWIRDDYTELKHMVIVRGYILIEEVDKDESNYTPSRAIRNLSRHVHEEPDTLRSSSL